MAELLTEKDLKNYVGVSVFHIMELAPSVKVMHTYFDKGKIKHVFLINLN